MNDRPVSEDDSVDAVEARRGVCVPREPCAVAGDDVPGGIHLLRLGDCLVGDPHVRQRGAVREALRRELVHAAEAYLAELRAAHEHVAPHRPADKLEPLDLAAALERAVVEIIGQGRHDLAELGAVGGVPLPESREVRGDEPFEVD